VNIGRVVVVAAAVGAGLFAPVAAAGQYFGRNKVQYETFHFEVLRTPHFKVYFYPKEREAARQAARLAERWYARYARLFNHQLSTPQPLVLYASHPDFEQTNIIQGELDEATGGVTEATRRRIVLPLAGPLDETDHVIGHELVHAFQYDITGEAGSQSGGYPGATRLPLWFIEGMAEYMSIGPVDPNTAMWLRDAVRHDQIPSLKQLDDPKYFPYRWGQAFWAYMTGRYGDDAVGLLLRTAGKSGDAYAALEAYTHEKVDSLSKEWQQAVRDTYRPLEAVTAAPDSFGHPVVANRGDAQLYLAPALSPDGNRIAFFSERGLFSIELYLADVATGRIERKLVRTALDPHYESVGFISSAGAWDASGTRFAFGGVVKSRPVLSIIEVKSDKVAQEIPFPTLGQIFDPTWSPDGQSIVFSALDAGWTDLFLYDLKSGKLRRLTNDAFADMQPAWSPDGRSIAFATDRFTTNLDELKPGPYRLALYDLPTGTIRALPAMPDAKHINPHWSPDGKSLYAVSDRGGIDNVYRLDLASGSWSQITNLFVGASGITASSPVISVARQTGELVFTAYDSTGYRLYAVNDPARLAGTPLTALPGEQAATLPPASRRPSDVAATLADATTGLPAQETASASTYHPGLSLDHVAQPYLAVGADRFGAFVGGGAALVWSDMLGDHNLLTALQVGGTLKDIGAVAAYENMHRRLNWGVAAQQVPYLVGGYAAGYGTLNGQTVYIEQAQLVRQTNRSLVGFGDYPLSRVQRIEVQAGAQSISFSNELQTRVFDPVSGGLIYDSTTNLGAPPALTMGVASAALVYDNSYFGATSPLLGSRYRVEVSPTIGDLRMVNLLVDYRRYVMPTRKLTLAARVLHYGRYGASSNDSRLNPLFIGYSDLVRGYNVSSFNTSECVGSTTGTCPVFDRLVGSRILVGNLEARVPLLGLLGLGHGYYGAFPIEAAAFVDGGVAWNSSDQKSLFDVRRQGVASAGGALRMNLFGFAVAELDYVKPFDRPNKGWYWQLGLTPGF
jgi:WD40-like Beta Propeller Repeat